MNDIFPQEVNYRIQRIPIGPGIKVERASQEVVGAVGNKKLHCRCHIPFKIVYHAESFFFSYDKGRLLYPLSFHGVFVHQLAAVGNQCI